MGGMGSGRHGGRPTADMCNRIDIAWMIRTKRVIPGCLVTGSLTWTCGGHPAGSVGYEADMRQPDGGELRLIYTRGSGADKEHVRQTIRLTYTEPNYGGRRWWMICPYSGRRVGKLYLPRGGDRFAGRMAWRLGYQSQRVERSQRPFEALFRLQRKLGCEQGWEAPLIKPKGMWWRTFDRHLDRYEGLDERCAVAMAGVFGRWGLKI